MPHYSTLPPHTFRNANFLPNKATSLHTSVTPLLLPSEQHYNRVYLASGHRLTAGSRQLNISGCIVCKCPRLETRRVPAVSSGNESYMDCVEGTRRYTGRASRNKRSAKLTQSPGLRALSMLPNYNNWICLGLQVRRETPTLLSLLERHNLNRSIHSP
jgi:hypothetical protein